MTYSLTSLSPMGLFIALLAGIVPILPAGAASRGLLTATPACAIPEGVIWISGSGGRTQTGTGGSASAAVLDARRKVAVVGSRPPSTDGTLTQVLHFRDKAGGGDLTNVHTNPGDLSARYMHARLAEVGPDYTAPTCSVIVENAALLRMHGTGCRLNPRALNATGVLEHDASSGFQAMADGCRLPEIPKEVVGYQRLNGHVDPGRVEGVSVSFIEPSAARRDELARGALARAWLADAQLRAMRQAFSE